MKVVDLRLSDKLYIVDNYSFHVMELIIASISRSVCGTIVNRVLIHAEKGYYFEFEGFDATHCKNHRAFTTYKEALVQVEKNKQKELDSLERRKQEIEEKIKKFKNDYRN